MIMNADADGNVDWWLSLMIMNADGNDKYIKAWAAGEGTASHKARLVVRYRIH